MVRSSRIAGIISLFAVGASAVAIKRQDTSKWTATKYQWGCSPGGCSATFNLEGPKNYPLGAPAFSVVCSPVYIQQDWVECKNPDGSDMGASSKVYSVWQAGPDEQEQYISIAHIYNNGSWYEARSGPNGLLPEKGATIFFVVNSVVPAADNHLPPPTKTASPTLGVHLGENGEPASTNVVAHELYASDLTVDPSEELIDEPQSSTTTTTATTTRGALPAVTSTGLTPVKPLLTDGARKQQGDKA